MIAAADEARGGRPPLRPDPVELGDDEVLARVSELLDRKLFEASVSAEVTGIAADVHGFEETVAAVLGVLGRIVDYDLAAVCMLDDRLTYLTVARETSQQQYTEFFGAIADAATQVTGTPVMVHDLVPAGRRPARAARARTTRAGWRPSCRCRCGPVAGSSGCLALSSATKNAFGEASLNTLRLVEQPAAVVISNARLAGDRRSHV